DTFAAIAPASVPGFIAVQLAGAVVGLALVAVIFMGTGPAAAPGDAELS
ncbi:aquaporin family protein, partial [Streptomyces goshikiensis]